MGWGEVGLRVILHPAGVILPQAGTSVALSVIKSHSFSSSTRMHWHVWKSESAEKTEEWRVCVWGGGGRVVLRGVGVGRFEGNMCFYG